MWNAWKLALAPILAAGFAGDRVALAQSLGDAELGREKSTVCLSCHGADGIGVGPNVPNLRGQKPEYVVNALRAYKNRDRRDPVAVLMYPFASELSDQDMRDLAAYYASLANCSTQTNDTAASATGVETE